jgi:hypothetical protein
MSPWDSVARSRLDRIAGTEVARRRVTIELRRNQPLRAANDNGASLADRIDQLWPALVALLGLAWALLSVLS